MENYLGPEGPKYTGCLVKESPTFNGTVKVVSFNIRFSEKIDEISHEFDNYESLRDADIILLQEMDEVGTESIARILLHNYVYYPASVHTHHNKNFGNAILSKWRIKKDCKIILPHANPTNGQRRIAVAATIEIQGNEVTAYSVHTEVPWLSQRKRLEQVDALLKCIPNNLTKTVVGGDFNTASKRNIVAIEQIFKRAGLFRATKGTGHTSRLGPFSLTLDHLFVRQMKAIKAGKLERSKASDHFPIFVQLEID